MVCVLKWGVQSYAQKKQVAISPIVSMPHKTLFHELEDVELGHTAEASFNGSEITPRSLKEVEAKTVTLLLCELPELSRASIAGSSYIINAQPLYLM